MSFVFKNSLPTPAEIREQYPVSKELLEIKKQRDNEIADILMGRNDKFMVIIGPCSADSEDSVLDYVS
ncbi:MAG: 3-deoxy-7-phosphoheptulonate synthase, partial [Lachnospiraceae bacterium]|nr:3-deoxy-7-phosphoheptulonate synthase [Lachnospiraceae bacterium]